MTARGVAASIPAAAWWQRLRLTGVQAAFESSICGVVLLVKFVSRSLDR